MPHQLLDYLKDTSLTYFVIGIITTIAAVIVHRAIASLRSRTLREEHRQIDVVRTKLLTESETARATIAAELLIKTATAQSPNASSGAEDIKAQVQAIRYELNLRKAEDEKGDAILEATLRAGMSNLDRRIETLEKEHLTRWDIATTVFTLMGGTATVIGVIFSIFKFLHP